MSVPNTIAEGSGRGTKKDFLAFLRIARGSLRELDTQIEIASRTGAISETQAAELLGSCEAVGKMLTRLIQTLREPPNIAP